MINKIKGLLSKLKKNKIHNKEFKDQDIDTPDLPTNDEIYQEHNKISFKNKILSAKTDILSKITEKKLSHKSHLSKKTQLKYKTILINIFDCLTNPSKRNLLHRYFQFTFIFFIIFSIAKITSISLQKNDKKGLSVSFHDRINEQRDLKTKSVTKIKVANLFQTNKPAKIDSPKNNKPKEQKSVICEKADKKSRLPIKLINTIVLQDTVKSIASVQVRSESLFREIRQGEKIPDMAQIDRIERLRLIVKNLKTGNCESIESSNKEEELEPAIQVMSKAEVNSYKKSLKPISGIKNDGNNFEIKRSFLKDKMKNISDILTQARGIQINNPDGTISFKIVDVQPGSVYSYLGIQNGDIITAINGEKINDLNAVMSLFSKLTVLDKASITKSSGGTQITQNYNFK
ncbi:MAG: hypothetical protein N4A33_06800 [Bacteriovoracaceae bacterium]|jgi:type II secretory pathway component PulC|nr:hypothetical protein [Bacteriovoracaceae bacterium]